MARLRRARNPRSGVAGRSLRGRSACSSTTTPRTAHRPKPSAPADHMAMKAPELMQVRPADSRLPHQGPGQAARAPGGTSAARTSSARASCQCRRSPSPRHGRQPGRAVDQPASCKRRAVPVSVPSCCSWDRAAPSPKKPRRWVAERLPCNTFARWASCCRNAPLPAFQRRLARLRPASFPPPIRPPAKRLR